MKQAQFFYRNPNAPKPNRPNHIGTSVLIEHEERLLLEHRMDSDTWAVIGGGLRTDESLLDCALREVREETGLRLPGEALALYRIYDDPSRIASYPDGNVLRVITVVYRVQLKDCPALVCSGESRELRFFPKEELRGVKIAGTHIPILSDYLGE